MIIVIYGVILLFFWLRATRMKPQSYPNLSADAVFHFRDTLIKSYKKYALLYFGLIALALGLNALGHHTLTKDEMFHFISAPLSLQIAIIIVVAYAIFMLFFTLKRAYKNHQLGRELGIY